MKSEDYFLLALISLVLFVASWGGVQPYRNENPTLGFYQTPGTSEYSYITFNTQLLFDMTRYFFGVAALAFALAGSLKFVIEKYLKRVS